jgi:hypothetical protein
MFDSIYIDISDSTFIIYQDFLNKEYAINAFRILIIDLKIIYMIFLPFICK